ncbi:transposase [Rhodopila sp.]|uniref:transposase n=1 Tax=Rhodopila sp. TaxID=2480087 RepID=UPI003D13C418
MASEHWLANKQWSESLIPTRRRGVRPGRNRTVINGIPHVLKYGCRWRDCPSVCGPHMTIYKRFKPLVEGGIWQQMLQ